MKFISDAIVTENIIPLVNIIAILTASYVVSLAITQTIDPNIPFKPKVAVVSSPQKNITLKPLYLFGIESNTQPRTLPQATKNPSPIIKTPFVPPAINLKLVGVIQSPIENRSVAIIRKKSVPGIYGIGDMIDGNTKLLQVVGDKVVVSYYDKIHTLVFKKASIADLSTKKIATKKIKAIKKIKKSKILKKPNNRFAKNSKKYSKTKKTEKINLPVSFNGTLSNIKYKLQTEPLSLINLIKGTPIFRNGKMAGVKVHPGNDKKLFKALGLKPKDMIISVNDIALSDTDRLSELMALANNATNFEIELERNGLLENISVALP